MVFLGIIPVKNNKIQVKKLQLCLKNIYIC
jgi:hypothetical protein